MVDCSRDAGAACEPERLVGPGHSGSAHFRARLHVTESILKNVRILTDWVLVVISRNRIAGTVRPYFCKTGVPLRGQGNCAARRARAALIEKRTGQYQTVKRFYFSIW